MSLTSRELPMPTITRLTSLSQAHATLLHFRTKLYQTCPSEASTVLPNPSLDERQSFQAWLEQWESAFTTYLSSAMASMTNGSLTQSRILKTNHLACTILVSDLEPGDFDVYEAEFRAIIELAGAVLRSRYFADSPQESKAESESDAIPFAARLDVKEPLNVVAARCTESRIRRRAEELLAPLQPR